MIVLLLEAYGFVTAAVLSPFSTPAPQPVGSATSSLTTVNSVANEVFHISDNRFTYDDAPAVCAAYDAKLATLEQIIEAYNHGAEWCGYGWSAGGMALYPTQKGTWDALQQEVDSTKRTACGRPGVNGGYFDPTSKFGVNCYGYKPQGTVVLPTPLPGSDPNAFADAVSKWKGALKSFSLDPFSRDTWSASPLSAGRQFINNVNKENYTNYGGLLREHLVNATEDIEVAPGHTSADTAAASHAPYGLIGSQGSTGPQGPVGNKGDKGDPGVSNAPGPQGPSGPAGPAGPASTVPGPAGPIGPAGSIGPASTVPGPQGQKGDKGDKGDKGNTGDPANIGGKTTLGRWLIDGTSNKGDDVRFAKDGTGKDGEGNFIIRANNGWSEIWLRRGPNWKRYD
jgi:hypothetical protein